MISQFLCALLRRRLMLVWTMMLGNLVPCLLGQVAPVRAGSLEVGPFVGASYGIDKFRVMTGGNITYALGNKYVLPYFEYSYFPGLPRTESPVIPNVGPVTVTYSLPVSDIHGGVHVRLPIKESPIVPYLVFGVGALHYPSTTEQVTYTSFGQTVTVPSTTQGSSDFAINGGGGVRYYLGGTGKFGFRAEAKVYKATSGIFSNTLIGKVEVGFFFQLH